MYELVCWTIPVKIWVEIEIWCLLPCLISHRKGGLKLHHQIMRSIFVYSSKTSRLACLWMMHPMGISSYVFSFLLLSNPSCLQHSLLSSFYSQCLWHHSVCKSYQKISFHHNTSETCFLIFTLFKTFLPFLNLRKTLQLFCFIKQFIK